MIALYVFFGISTFVTVLFLLEKDNPNGGYVEDLIEHSLGAILSGIFWPFTWGFSLLWFGVIKPIAWLADRR